MVRITCSDGDTYAYEYLKGYYNTITFIKYKKHNIAIPGIKLKIGDTVVIDELTNRRSFWTRGAGKSAVLRYEGINEEELKGQGFELYTIVGCD